MSKAQAERWLGYVESKAHEGYLYERGVTECRSAGIEKYPALQARLDAAIALAQQKRRILDEDRMKQRNVSKAKQWLGYISEHVASGRWYLKGEQVVLEQIRALQAVGYDVSELERSLKDLREKHESSKTGGFTGETYTLHGASGYGCHGWRPGDVVFNAKGTPPFLFVLSATKRYVPEDGMSFGVGAESGYLYTAVCREASDEESAPLRARLEHARKQQEALESLREIRECVMKSGRQPEDFVPFPQGEVLIDTMDMYGGGECWVVTPDAIWYIRNNGGDGDNWQHNNVRTGGAGGIGWYIPRDEALVERLTSIATCLRGEP